MRVARRTVLASAMASLATPALLRLACADTPPVTLKLHHFFSAVSSIHDKFLVPWARQIEADSGGRLRVDIFPSMQLGGQPGALFEQVKSGDADIAWTTPSLTPGRFPKIETWDLPFIQSRRALVSSKALQDFSALYLKDEFADVHPLCFSCTDRGVIHANGPIRTVADVKDLKLHVRTRFAGETMRVLGAQPVPMPDGQITTAIPLGVIDGCIDPWHMVPPLRLNDLLKTHTEFSDWSLSSTTFVLAMNKDSYDRLPKELKPIIDRNSGMAAAAMAGTMWDVQAATVANDIAERGDVIVTLLPEAVAHWRKATEPVVNSWLKEMREQKVDGGKMLAAIRAFLTKYQNEPEPLLPQNTPAAEQDVSAQPAAKFDSRFNGTPDVKTDTVTPPKAGTSQAQPPAAVTKPAATPSPAAPAPTPHVATRGTAPATTPSVAAPVQAPVPTAPVARPVPAPPAPVAAAPPSPPAPTAPPPSAPPPATVAAPTAPSLPPVLKPVPAPAAPAKGLNIPL